ncbi:MAG: cytochrome c [Polyangiales bacterium]
MRSGKLTAFATTIAISLFAGCGGSGYGDYDDDGEESRTDQVEARDGGGSDARVKDGGAARSDGGAWADGGGGAGGGDDDDEDGDDGDDDDVVADAGAADAGKGDAGGGADACATLTYQTFGRQFLTNYCVSCHGSSGGLSLTSLANVTRAKANVKSMVTSKSMPLGGKLPSDDERTRFAQWIDCGPK